jgi:DNA-3-methyladenine glycosylase
LSAHIPVRRARKLPKSFFQRPAIEVARELIGVTLLVDGVGGTVVETEAYDQTDPASHSFNGQTVRNRSMFGPAGRAYVYRSYGIHWCLNTVCESASAVLIRALEPAVGIELMRERRGLSELSKLCSGPGRLCQALAITGVLDGNALDAPPFTMKRPTATPFIVTGRRIGITRGVEAPWRFGLAGSAFLSRALNQQ